MQIREDTMSRPPAITTTKVADINSDLCCSRTSIEQAKSGFVTLRIDKSVFFTILVFGLLGKEKNVASWLSHPTIEKNLEIFFTMIFPLWSFGKKQNNQAFPVSHPKIKKDLFLEIPVDFEGFLGFIWQIQLGDLFSGFPDQVFLVSSRTVMWKNGNTFLSQKNFVAVDTKESCGRRKSSNKQTIAAVCPCSKQDNDKGELI